MYAKRSGTLGPSIWAFSALASALEAGMLECLSTAPTPSYVSEQTGVPVALVERLLDVLVALGLLSRERCTPLQANLVFCRYCNRWRSRYLLADLRATYLQVENLIDELGGMAQHCLGVAIRLTLRC